MKLSEKSITAVIEHQKDGTTYSYYVICKGGISNNRNYINHDSSGRTTAEPYMLEWLPKTVQQFISKHMETTKVTEEENVFADGDLFTTILYK